MFRVECTSCKAAYQVDERRVPAKGLMMKCPKCRASFLVSPPESLVDLAKKATPQAPPNEATAPLPDVQPKVAAELAPKASNESLGDLPAPLQKSFELPASRARVRNDETMIGIAPSAANMQKPATATASAAALPAIKSPSDVGVGLNKASDLKAPTRSPFGVSKTSSTSTATGLPATAGMPTVPKPTAKSGGPISPIGVRKVSRISLPPLSTKSQPEPEAPRSEKAPASLAEPKPPSTDVDLPAVVSPSVAGEPFTMALEQPSKATPEQFSKPTLDEFSKPTLDEFSKATLDEVSSSADDEFELPDVFGGKPKPATSRAAEPPIFGASREALPAVKVTSIDDDLPAALGTSTASLPAVSDGHRAAEPSDDPLDFGSLNFGDDAGQELGAQANADDDGARHSSGIVDLDSEALETVPPSAALDGSDLPDLFGVDLPSIPPSVAATSEPGFDDAGLGFGELDLPALDTSGTSGEAPAAPLGGQLPSFQPSEPPAIQSSSPPSFRARQDSFGDFEGLPSFGETAAASQAVAAVSKRTADIEAHDPFEDDSFSLGSSHEQPATSARGTESGVSSSRTAANVGGREYGQVNLEDTSGSINPEMEDEMEFGGIPQAESEPPEGGEPLSQGPSHVAPEVKPAGARAPEARAAEPAKPKSKRLLKIGAAAAVVVLGGAALSLDPRIGPFGAFAIGDLISRSEHQALLQRHEEAVSKARLNDRYAAVVTAGTSLEQAASSAKRFTPLQVATATHQLATVLRFGGPSRAQSAAQVLLSELQAEGVDPAEYATARAINTILTQGAKTPAQALEPLPNTLLAYTVRGEYWLLVGDGKKALEAWSKAAELSRGPWTLFGIARAQFASDQLEAAIQTARSVLELEPEHAGAALLTADALLQSGKAESVKAETLVHIATSETNSPREVALAHTLNGELELDLGRVGKALEGFEAALRIHPNDPRALTASGNALLSSGRHSAALARFQAAKTADPRALGAALGEVRAQLALQQVDAAKPLIAALQREHGKELEVHAVVGSVALALGEVETAKKVLTDAAAASKAVAPEVAGTPNFQRVAVEIYVSLAAAYNRSGAPEQAAPILREALEQLPKSSALRTALGDVALSQGQYEKALAEYNEAQRLAPNELEPVFKAGSVLRRLKRFDEATGAFDKVAAADPEYIGLPLERGLILEQSGKIALALAQYEAALANAPGDLDVQLRVGCGRVVLGNARGAREVLKEVIEKRPQSAEAAHCLGRALFAEGGNLEALRWLRQAVDLDGNNAQYHLYLGWVASDAAQIALAQKELNRALALDPGLADAYWQRGVLNLKQGAARDATLDFKKTLELKPDRYDANADMAQALSQLGKEKDAIPYWEKAIAADPNNAVWLFRYGKLLVGRQQMAKGTELLQRAINVASKAPPKPNWLWQAHYWAALGSGESPGAVKHWKEYLNLSSPDSPYRDEAKRALKRAGQTWEGN